MSNFEAAVTLPDGYRVAVTAEIGTQAVSDVTGNPLPVTEPGVIQLMVVEGGPNRACITFTDPTFAAAVRDMLDRAIKVADTRDYSLDKVRERL
jgi:hypothetical protein